jgi:hypothetical protein
MKKGSTNFLRLVIFIIGLAALAVLVFILPIGLKSELTVSDFDYGPIMLGLYVTAVPFFIALYQALKLLNYIDKNIAFSESSINSLRNIKYCAVTISGLFVAGMPYIFYVADKDDAPGVVALALVIAGSSFVIAVFAAVLQKLIQSGMEIKSENELTV